MSIYSAYLHHTKHHGRHRNDPIFVKHAIALGKGKQKCNEDRSEKGAMSSKATKGTTGFMKTSIFSRNFLLEETLEPDL